MSSSGVILNPALYQEYHCAILSAEQDQGIGHFSLEQVNQFLNFKVDNFGDICRELTSYWGSIVRLDGIELDCSLFMTNEKKRLYLIFDWDFERLETRVTRLGYLLNQRAILILPKGGEKVRRYILNGNGLTFEPMSKEREHTDIYNAIHYYFRYIYQQYISAEIDYKENWRFHNASAMSKGGLNHLGKRVDKKLSQITIGEYFDIKLEDSVGE